MNREIKFRAWHTFCKTMIDWVAIKQVNPTLEYMQSGVYEWLQYTGLKDKNGKEIYEGDIVRGTGNNAGIISKVGIHTFCAYPHIPSSGYEVIGNAYEHNYLLEDKLIYQKERK